MTTPVMGIQLYTLRDHIQTKEDFDKTLARLSAMGVDTVQISGIGDIPAEDQKEVLDRYNMKVCVTHKGLDRMENDLAGLIREHKIIGCDALGLGAMPGEARESEAALRDFIAKTARIGETLRGSGMTFHYHNHDFEFRKLPGTDKTLMDVLLEETDPALFHFIPDVAWIHYGGYDPVEILTKMKGRVKVIHFKDYIVNEAGERKFVSLGKGKVDLKACYEAAKALDMPYIMYEQDCDWTDNDPFKATEESWAFMRELQA